MICRVYTPHVKGNNSNGEDVLAFKRCEADTEMLGRKLNPEDAASPHPDRNPQYFLT